MDPTEPAIRDALAGGKGLSTREIAAVSGSTPRATRTRLVRLVEGGVVRNEGKEQVLDLPKETLR